jgi:2Fe-2S ferredoxin
MPSITFLGPGDQQTTVAVTAGQSVMQAAVSNGFDGIVAECGGTMSCATCHIFVDPAFLRLLPPRSETEDQMLDFTAEPRAENSRLSCQVTMTEALDGLVARIPDQQL